MALEFGARFSLRDNFTASLKQIKKQQTQFRKDVDETRKKLDLAYKKKRELQIKTAPANKAIREVVKKLEPLRKKIVAAVALKDHIANRIAPIKNKLASITKKTWNTVVAVKDKTAAALKSIGGKLAKLAKGISIGVGIAGGAAIAGSAALLKSGMTLERQQVSMEHFIGVQNKGMSKEQVKAASSQYVKDLRAEADKSPFETGELISAGARAINIAGGNTTQAMDMVKLAEDMAALNPEKSLSDAIEALADLKVGETERMKEFGFKISQDDIKKAGGVGNVIQKQLKPFFKGGSEKLSQTGAGLLSTITGNLKSGMSDTGLKMLEKLKPVLEKVVTAMPKFTNMLKKAGEVVAEVFGVALTKIGQFFGKISQYFSQNKGQLNSWAAGFGQVFTTIGQTFQGLIQFIAPRLPTIMNFIGGLIKTVGQFAAAILPPLMGFLKSVIGWFVDNMPTFQKAISSIFEAITPIIKVVIGIIQTLWDIWVDMFPTIANILSTVWENVLRPILTFIADILKVVWIVLKGLWLFAKPVLNLLWKLLKPIVESIGFLFKTVGGAFHWLVNKVTGGDDSKSHAYGLNRVPYDGYKATLHEGEKILTKNEANNYDRGGKSVVVNKLADTLIVREEADIDKVAIALVRELEKSNMNYGGAY